MTGKLVQGPWKRKRQVKNSPLPLLPLTREFGVNVVEFPERITKTCIKIMRSMPFTEVK
jgi:hypothetical protein